MTVMGIGNIGLFKGEIQKLALARVLIRQPRIIILDEQLSHIDIKSVNEILRTLKAYNKKTKATIIIISHDDRIESIADETTILEKIKQSK